MNLAIKYLILQGNGKIVRHLYFKQNETIDEVLLREVIDESVVKLYTLSTAYNDEINHPCTHTV